MSPPGPAPSVSTLKSGTRSRDVPEGPLRVTDRRFDLVPGEVLGPEVDGHLAPVDRRVALAIRHGRLPFPRARATTPSSGPPAPGGSRSHHWLLPPPWVPRSLAGRVS
jgi:hypothetical protein